MQTVKYSVSKQMKVTGILLAGGKSSRMGQEKGLIPFLGKPLISFAIRFLSKTCDLVLISSDSEKYHSFGFEVVPDEIPGRGPMGGIYSCLKHSYTQSNLILSCDMPFVSTELINYLIKNSDGYQATVPWHFGDHFEPMCAIYDKSMIPVLETFMSKDNYKLPDVFREVALNAIRIDEKLSFYHPHLFFNINSDSDLDIASNLSDFIEKIP